MIYYIYKVRRKQTFIRSSRSALSHRYLRYISWISWNGGHRPPQAGSQFHLVPQSAHTSFSRRRLHPKAAIAATLSPPPLGEQANILRSFLQEKEKHPSSLFPRASCARRSSCVALPASSPHVPPIRGRSAARPSRRFCGLPINKKCGPAALRREPAQKSVDFSLKKTHVGTPGLHALASAVLFFNNDGPHSLLPFFLSPFLQGKEKRKQKQIQQVRIHRSDSLRSSSRCTRLARRASSAEIYVAIATRFVQDCVEDLDLLAASMERISKCSWHIKDHYLGVNKASRTSSYFCVSFPAKSFPKKI